MDEAPCIPLRLNHSANSFRFRYCFMLRNNNTFRVLKSYQIWDGFFALAKLNGGSRSSATLTGGKQSQSGKDAQR